MKVPDFIPEKILYGKSNLNSNSGIQGLRNLGIEGILSLLIY
jgi:hypothetical protein